MDFLEMVLARESCRAYSDTPVTREQLMKIVDAGRLSPSGCNAQPWKFMIVDEADALVKMRDALTLDNGATACAWGYNVPAFIAIVEQTANVMPMAREHYGTTQRFAPGDIAMAALNMCYEAMSLGLSTCIVGMNEQKKMEKNFGIPEGCEVRIVLAVGYAAENTPPRPKKRKPIEEVCCFNEWQD